MKSRKLLIMLAFIGAHIAFIKNEVFAWDLAEYIAGEDFIPHSLSTGEYIHFTAEGGTNGIRQYKNNNYEQFFIKSDGIYRREDTSWAPLDGFKDAHCTNGNKAIYALHPSLNFTGGDVANETGTLWAPRIVNEIGVPWNTQDGTIVPVDSGVSTGEYNYNLPPLIPCNLVDLPGYPAVSQGGQLQIRAHYNPGEFTFCTGATNPADLLVISGVSGPGYDDVFYYMKGWGLVGFETTGWEAGLASGPGVVVGEKHPPECTIITSGDGYKEARVIIGQVTSSKERKNEVNAEESYEPVKGMSVCVYQGGGSSDRLPYYLTGFEVGGQTEGEDQRKLGQFEIETWLRHTPEPDVVIDPEAYITNMTSQDGKYNYLAFISGETIHKVIRVNLNNLAGEGVPAKYSHAFENRGINPDFNTLILEPIEVTVNVDPDSAGSGFPADEHPTCPYDPSEPHMKSCIPESERGYWGWNFAARNHVTGAVDGRCPQYLPYTDRRASTQLACAGGDPNNIPIINPTAGDSVAPFKLSSRNTQHDGGVFDQIWSFLTWDDHDVGLDILLGNDVFEGKQTGNNFSSYLEYAYVQAAHFLTGGISLGPKELPKNPESDALYDLYSCELLKEANTTYNPGSPVNRQEIGILSLLASPYSENEGELKALYEQMGGNMDEIDVCCIKEKGDYSPCDENANFVSLADIKPYNYMLDDDENYPLVECTTSPSGWCPDRDVEDPYLYPASYFPSWMVYRKAFATKAGLNMTKEKNVVDSIDTEYRRSEGDAPGEGYLGQLEPYEDDPIDDEPIGADCETGAKCGAAEQKKIMAPFVLSGAPSLTGMLDTNALQASAEAPIQPPISTLASYTKPYITQELKECNPSFESCAGYEYYPESGKYYRIVNAPPEDSPTSIVEPHLDLTTQHKCSFSILDGHNTAPVEIKTVPLRGSTRGDGDYDYSNPGTYAAAYDYQLKCKAGTCRRDVDIYDDSEEAPEFIDVPYLSNLLDWFSDIISYFFREQCEVDQVSTQGCGCCGQDPRVWECCMAGCYWDPEWGEEGAYVRENDKFSCTPATRVPANFQVSVNQTVNMERPFNNLNTVLESLRLPRVMRVENSTKAAKVVDARSMDSQTTNNEEGYGGIIDTNIPSPEPTLDELRELVRSYPASLSD